VKKFEEWLNANKLSWKGAANMKQEEFEAAMDEAGIGRFQKGEVRAHVDDLKPAPAPAPQPGKPPLLPLYFSGRDVGDELIFYFSLTFLFFFFSSFFFVFFFFFPSSRPCLQKAKAGPFRGGQIGS